MKKSAPKTGSQIIFCEMVQAPENGEDQYMPSNTAKKHSPLKSKPLTNSWGGFYNRPLFDIQGENNDKDKKRENQAADKKGTYRGQQAIEKWQHVRRQGNG